MAESFPWDQMDKTSSKERVTPLIYRGGKSSIAASWIIPNFPQHERYVDVFGGGGGVLFAKGKSKVEIYNDLGNVALFMWVLREYGDELYHKLYLTPWSREEFNNCSVALDVFEKNYLKGQLQDYMFKPEAIEWARCWYVQIMQSFRHEENDFSWFVMKTASGAENFNKHVDAFPAVVSRLRGVTIENRDFAEIINLYDSKETFFYCDPPYLPGTWEGGAYENEMSIERHIELLNMLNEIKGMAMVSGYPSELYNEKLAGWRTITKTRSGGIKSASQVAAEKTEVLWIRSEHELWNESKRQEQAILSELAPEKTDVERARNALNRYVSEKGGV